jgi:hypothetical protein
MVMAYGTHGEMKNAYKICMENPKGKDHSEDICILMVG